MVLCEACTAVIDGRSCPYCGTVDDVDHLERPPVTPVDLDAVAA